MRISCYYHAHVCTHKGIIVRAFYAGMRATNESHMMMQMCIYALTINNVDTDCYENIHIKDCNKTVKFKLDTGESKCNTRSNL